MFEEKFIQIGLDFFPKILDQHLSVYVGEHREPLGSEELLTVFDNSFGFALCYIFPSECFAVIIDCLQYDCVS